MNEFQILDAEGQAIKLSTLDQEAATFWGKDVHEKQYAFPQVKKENETEWDFICRSSNWFDVIAWNIAQQTNYTSGWANVINTMITESLGQAFITFPKEKGGQTDVNYGLLIQTSEEHYSINFSDKTLLNAYVTLEFYKPYIELCNHWASKGYKPIQIKKEGCK